MSKPLQALLAIVLLSLLSSCSLTPTQPANIATLSWPERQHLLQQITSFQVSGKAALQTAQGGGQFRFHWQHTPGSSKLLLNAPFGQGTVQLQQTTTGYVLIDAGGEEKISANGNQLLYETTGLYVPLEALPAWLMGLPASSLPTERISFNAAEQVDVLWQQGWQLHYSLYVQQSPVALPTKLSIQYGNSRIKLLIQSWQVGEPSS